MLRWSLFAAALALVVVDGARADRTPMTRSPGQRHHGVRTDITVPYLTTGGSNFGVWNRVEPRVYSSPIVDDPRNPQAKRVYNLIFYGSVMSFGDRSNGATPATRK